MTKTLRLPMSRLALMLGLALSAMATQAADLATANASVSNLRYRLIDLDLNDGIAPSLTVTGGWVATANTTTKLTTSGTDFFGAPYTITGVEQNPADADKSITSTVFAQTGTLELLSGLPGAKSTLGPTISTSVGLSAQAIADSQIITTSTSTFNGVAVDLSRDDNLLRNVTQTVTWTNNNLKSQQSANASITPAMSTEVLDPETGGVIAFPAIIPNLTISANTLLVIEGTASLGVHMDQAGIRAAAKAGLGEFTSDYDGRYISSANSTLTVDLGDLEGFSELTPSFGGVFSANKYQIDSFNLTSGFNTQGTYSYDLGEDASALDSIETRDFQVSVANLSGVDLQKMLRISLASYSAFDGSIYRSSSTTTWGDPVSDIPVPTPTPTPGIPEPSTYALMGLGLVGVAVAARRRRQGI